MYTNSRSLLWVAAFTVSLAVAGAMPLLAQGAPHTTAPTAATAGQAGAALPSHATGAVSSRRTPAAHEQHSAESSHKKRDWLILGGMAAATALVLIFTLRSKPAPAVSYVCAQSAGAACPPPFVMPIGGG